jgi:hypothetical protein
MSILGIIITVLGITALVWACINYARCSWYANCDLMGASMTFTFFWLLGTVFVSAGLLIASVLGLWSAVAVGIGLIVAGKLFEWFGIEPLLSRLFHSYRKDSA